MSRHKNAKSARRFFRRRPLNARALRESARVQPDLSMQSRVSSGFTWCASVSYTHLTLPTTPYV